MLNHRNFLHGKLVGIGKVHKDGSEDFRWLDKPIHNRIVSGGIDNLLMFNGGQSISSEYGTLFLGANSYYRGAFDYTAYGSSSSPTNFNDTGLYDRVSGYIYKKKNDLCGSTYKEFPRILHRIAHEHDAAAQATDVREIGWFQKQGNNYVLSSRVVLDTPYHLDAGEKLITAYELDVTYGNGTAQHLSRFGSLLDENGNPLQADYMTILNKDYTPYIGSNGYGKYNTFYADGKTYTGRWFPVWYMNHDENGFYISINRSSNQIDFDAAFTIPNQNWWLALGSRLQIIAVENYVKGSFYRDVSYTLPIEWPNDSPTKKETIRNMCIMGVHYKFGYWENGVWVPQAFRVNKENPFRVRIRQQWSTVDTV